MVNALAGRRKRLQIEDPPDDALSQEKRMIREKARNIISNY